MKNIKINENTINIMTILVEKQAIGYCRSGLRIARAVRDANIAAEILELLKTNPPMRVKEIQEKMGGPFDAPPTQKITSLLKDLCGSGLTRRDVNPNETEFVEFYDGFGKMCPIARYTLA